MSRLVADAGGTNVRFAIADATGALDALKSYRVEDFPAFADALAAYRAEAGAGRDIRAAAVAAAGPVDSGRVKLTNNDWSIDRDAIAAVLGAPTALVNDLEAVAAALPYLTVQDLRPFGGPAPVRPERRTMLAVNVGTGFGAASIIHRGAAWWTCPTEAGHMTLGAAEGVPFTNASIEDVLSGKGLARLYAQLAGAGGPMSAQNGDPGDVLARASQDAAAARAVELFTSILGRVAGDLVLATCAWGGVYLCGSVAVAWSAVADAPLFRAAFTRKGPMRSRMVEVPTAVLARDHAALFGLAMMPLPA